MTSKNTNEYIKQKGSIRINGTNQNRDKGEIYLRESMTSSRNEMINSKSLKVVAAEPFTPIKLPQKKQDLLSSASNNKM